jgi:hypothetical protein
LLPFGPGFPLLEVHHAERDSGIARRLATVAADFRSPVFPPSAGSCVEALEGAHASPVPCDTLRLLIAPEEAVFRRFSGGQLPDWGLAVAFPRAGRIVMRSPRLVAGAQDARQVLIHELVHLYLARSLGRAEPEAPRWFHEGLASLLAGEWGLRERFDLALALLAGRPIPLEQLEEGFPGGREAASLAYLESLAAAAYLRDLSGDEGLALLLGNLRRLEDFDAALRRTYGITYGEFERRWRESLLRRYGWATAAASSWTYWTPLAVAVIFIMFWRRIRYRRRLAELEREERRAEEREKAAEQERHDTEPGLAAEGETPRGAAAE